MIPAEILTPEREPVTRWWLLWTLYGLPRCSQASYPESAPHCNRLIWPWQGREVRNGAPVHVACLSTDPSAEHGFTCDLCQWGRDSVHTLAEYENHVVHVHPEAS